MLFETMFIQGVSVGIELLEDEVGSLYVLDLFIIRLMWFKNKKSI